MLFSILLYIKISWQSSPENESTTPNDSFSSSFSSSKNSKNVSTTTAAASAIPVAPGTKEVKGVSSTLLIILTMWFAIISYSLLVSYLTGCHYYEMVLHYILAMIAFYAWHWQAHRNLSWVPFNKKCKQMHMEHHFEVYPPDAFFGKGDPSKLIVTHESFFTAHEALLYILLIAILTICFLIGEKPSAIFFAFILDAVIGYVGNALHQSFHVKGHWLEQFEWYHELRAVHYVHHLGSTKFNYAVFNIGIDYLIGSLTLSEPVKKNNEIKKNSETDKISSSSIGGLSTLMMGMQHVPRANNGSWAIKRGAVTCLFRMLILYSLYVMWNKSESYFFSAPPTLKDNGITQVYDFGLSMVSTTEYAQNLLTGISLSTDLITLLLVFFGTFGPSIRPMLALIYSFFIRQGIMMLGTQLSPQGSLWRKPEGLGSIFVQFEENTQTISGIIMIIVIAITELLRSLPKNLQKFNLVIGTIGVMFLYANVHALLALRTVWTINILLGIVISRYSTIVAELHHEFVEELLP